MKNTQNTSDRPESSNDQAEPRQTSDANQPATEATKVDAAPAVGSGALFGEPDFRPLEEAVDLLLRVTRECGLRLQQLKVSQGIMSASPQESCIAKPEPNTSNKKSHEGLVRAIELVKKLSDEAHRSYHKYPGHLASSDLSSTDITNDNDSLNQHQKLRVVQDSVEKAKE